MNLKNYTSGIAAQTTISYIETYLIDAGATGIMKEIKDGQVVAIIFEMLDERGSKRLVKLPANVVQVQEYLWSEYLASHVRPRATKEEMLEQAGRTAWKIMQDWVQIQVSMIKLRQMSMLQVFLPYIWDGQKTYYEYLQGKQFKALPAPQANVIESE
jgi:hypothetical protein